MAQAVIVDSLLREWTGVSPCVGTNGTMTVGEEAPVRAEARRLVAVVDPLVSEHNGSLRPGSREAPAPQMDPERRAMFPDRPDHQRVEDERLDSIRCIRAAANAAVAVSGFLGLDDGGDPLVASMNVLARVFNSYRYCSAKTVYELRKDVNTLEEARRREGQAEQFFAYFNTSGDHFWGTIMVDGPSGDVFNVRREYVDMRDQVFGDLTDTYSESEDESVLDALANLNF